jgi:hypothetical protein
MQRPMVRRAFLKRAAALVGGLATALSTRSLVLAAPQQYPYFILNPEHGAGTSCPTDPIARHHSSHSCHGCQACHSHGANKLFRTQQAANAGRAHPNCKCVIQQGGTLPQGTFVALFGPVNKPHADVVDRRNKKTQAVLASR